MMGEVTQREHLERLLASDRRRRRNPFVQQYERGLFARSRPAANNRFVCQPPQDVQPALLVRDDLLRVEPGVQLGTGQSLSPLEPGFDNPAGAFDQCGIDLEFAKQSRRRAFQRSRSQQREHPVDILRGYEVQRSAQRPGSDDAPPGNRPFDLGLVPFAHAKADGPQGRVIILRLHRGQCAHDLGRILDARSIDVLIAKAPLCELHA
jgi:hypothetical protein